MAAAIFFTCAVHHGNHPAHMLLPAIGVDVDLGLAMRGAFSEWHVAYWDIVTAGVGLWYLTLRTRFPALVRGAAIFEDVRERQRQALEIHDNVVQGLATAKLRFEMDSYEEGLASVEETLAASRRIITDLLGDEDSETALHPGDFRRAKAASGEVGRMSTVTVGRRPPPSTPPHTYRTLVVDDVADLRQLYRRILERAGLFEIVAEAGDGNEASELAGRLQPDLVMLDVSMPDRDGMEILHDILKDAPGVTVVMVSGFEARRLEPLALERGAVAYLDKGITPDRLVGELLRALGTDPETAIAPATDRRRSGRRIDDQDITPEELLSFVAHEIRNPLSVVHGFADTLALDVEELGSDEIRHLCGRIAANARYLDGIVSSVLQRTYRPWSRTPPGSDRS